MARVSETLDDAITNAVAEIARESLSISMAGDGPWWQPAGRKLGGIPYHEWTWDDLDVCRRESQRMMTHNEFGIGGTTKRIDYVVDQGFKYSIVDGQGEVVRKADIEQLNEYLELITSANSFPELEAEIVARMDRDGEAFLRLFWNDDGIVDVRFVEPARVRPGPDADTSMNSIERWGIAVEPHDAKRITGYWIEPGIGETPELVPEAEIVHITHNNGGAIPRGIPVYQPVFENLRRCEDLLTGMSSIAKARAKIALIRKIAGLNAVKAENIKSRLTTGTQQNPDGTVRNVSIDEYPFGSVIRANQDETFEFPSSNVGAADLIQVLQADLRSIASLLSMPEWMFTGLADQKYSNAFVVEAPTLKAFRRLQGKLVKGLATGRYKSQASVLWRCLRMAADRRIISKEVLAKCKVKCVPPSLEARDKQSESSVNKTYLDAGVIDKQTVQESIGLNPVETNRRIAEEKAAAPPTPPMIPGAKPPSGPSPDMKPKLTKVGESWYTRDALEWITEGRDRSHLVKTKVTDKNGVSRTVYKVPAGYHKTGSEHAKDKAVAKADAVSRVQTKLAAPEKLKAADIQSLGEDLKSMTRPEIQSLRKELGLVGDSKKSKQELVDQIKEHAASLRKVPYGLKELTPEQKKASDQQDARRNTLHELLTRSGFATGKAVAISDLTTSLGKYGLDNVQSNLAVSEMVDSGYLKPESEGSKKLIPGDSWEPKSGVEAVTTSVDAQTERQKKWQARAESLNRVIPPWVSKLADALDRLIPKPFVKESLDADVDPFELADSFIESLLDAAENDPSAVDLLLAMLNGGADGTVDLQDEAAVQVGESWYSLDALEWITEGRDRSHLVKTKVVDKNGVTRTVYKKPSKTPPKTDPEPPKPDPTPPPKTDPEPPKPDPTPEPTPEPKGFSVSQTVKDIAARVANDPELEVLASYTVESHREMMTARAKSDQLRSQIANEMATISDKNSKEYDSLIQQMEVLEWEESAAAIAFNTAVKKQRKAEQSILIRAAKAAGGGGKLVGKAEKLYEEKTTPKEQGLWGSAFELLDALTPKDAASITTMKVGRPPSGRACYTPLSKTIRVMEHDSAAVRCHEIGHFIEDVIPGAGKAAREFLAKRVGNEKPVKFADKFPELGYESHEEGRKDDFEKLFPDNPASAYYVGKDYGNAGTEIMSMGLQLMREKPIFFAKTDPEYFQFVLSVMRREHQ